MKITDLCAAVWEAPLWLPRFCRREYPKAFSEYEARFAPLYAAAVKEAGEETDGVRHLAGEILDELERAWKRRRFWERSAVRVEEKQMIVDFLSPMLLEQSDPMCLRLAGFLRQEWVERWPKDPYQITTFSVLQNGFRNAIFGIDLAGKHLDPTRDR